MNLFAAVHATALGAALVNQPAGATHAQLTPTALARALDDRLPLQGVTVVVAGDRLSPSLHRRAVSAGADVHHYYGSAELSFVAWGAHAEDLRAFPGVDVSVRAGEIWVRSPYLCTGYDGPPGPLRRAVDGYATVGDRGFLTHGRLAVAGRPDAVSVGGATIGLAEVERVLRDAASGEVCAVGVRHGSLGQVIAVVVTVAGDHRVLRRVARSELMPAARPRLWFHLERLPETGSGKVDRAALVSLVSDGDSPARRLV
jgi:acyl-coenzyme A synthetase/AMP-(fatty) acid ligase